MNVSTAGKGTPYWYEWTVGLIKVVEMLNPDSGIASVSFQEAGVKGWDDVVVRYGTGQTEYVQVKHSRVGNNITFGSFVIDDENGDCLLQNLYGAWRKMQLSAANAKCIVFTNREAGQRTYQGRPPLLEFVAWLNAEALKCQALNDFIIPDGWAGAWSEWLDRMKEGNDGERLEFLRSFQVQTNQPELENLEQQLVHKLANVFGTTPPQSEPLLHALDHALRRWTHDHERVTTEDVFDVLVLREELDCSHPAPPPPAPFFPTRENEAKTIETALLASDSFRVVFLSAAPGAGKTSLLSRIEARRTEKPLSGIVGIRYFAFRPITPDSSLVPADADYYVRPERLWFDLLSQLRRELEGKLWMYRVPVRNNLLTWQAAREHVLRLANRLGNELGRPFAIVIDGIDHAARAGRYQPEIARDFFASLPGPDELQGKSIRLLVAGQPAEHYPDYPAWLRTGHPDVRVLGLGALGKGDVAMLFGDAKPPLPPEEWDQAVDAVTEAAMGNTLSVVFGVAEAQTCKTAVELRTRLHDRSLRDGLQSYYDSIWRYAFARLQSRENNSLGIETALAGTLSLIRERVTGGILASAFPSLGMTDEQWHLLLVALGPLIVFEKGGFRVLHNDVRVFLGRNLIGRPEAERQWVASSLADHYLKSTSNRRAAHASLFSLLRTSGREREWPKVFTVDWVFEAAALAAPIPDAITECESALRLGYELRDWNTMHEVACATETLERWQECSESGHFRDPNDEADAIVESPFFPPSELVVLPYAKWSLHELHQPLNDAKRILRAKDRLRAKALLEHWFAELSLSELADRLHEKPENPGQHPQENQAFTSFFEQLGVVCREALYYIEEGKTTTEVQQKALFYFERGWIERSCSIGPFQSLKDCFAGLSPNFINGYTSAAKRFAGDGHWKLIKVVLRFLHSRREKCSDDFHALAAWWALVTAQEKRCPGWMEILKSPKAKFAASFEDTLEAPLAASRARGWLEPSVLPSTIAEEIFRQLDISQYRSKSAPHYRLLFQTAAVLGHLAALEAKSKRDAARDLVRPEEVKRLAAALWDDGLTRDFDFHRQRFAAGELALELVQATFPLSQQHADALIDVGRPIVERWLGDHRRESLWELFRRAGDVQLLRSWLTHVLGKDGWLWEDSAESRDTSASEFILLAQQLGEDGLVNEVEERLRWLRITYRGHKEYAFDAPISWFNELAKAEPTSWRNHGLKLWTLSEACSQQGGDERCSWDLAEALGAAAFGCGPTDVWQLLTAEYPDCGTESWLRPTAHRIIAGFTEHLRVRPGWPVRDKLSCWCLAVGFSRWFNDEDVKQLVKLREALQNTATNEAEGLDIERAIHRLTPAEAKRNPRKDSTEHSSSTDESQDETPQSCLHRIENGEEVFPKTALNILRQLLAETPDEFDVHCGRILRAVGTNSSYGGSWVSYTSGSFAALLEIGRLVSDDLLWNLVSAAIRRAGTGPWWTQGVRQNLCFVLLARAAGRGASEIRAGLDRMLKMHDRWARGGQGELKLPSINLRDGEQVDTWSSLAARGLTFLLASRSCEIIESALVGIHALAVQEPATIARFLELTENTPWEQQWILNAAEVWAGALPNELERSRRIIESHHANGSLHLRLQAWLVLHRLNQFLGKSPPNFPNPPQNSGGITPVVAQPSREILESPPTQHGSFRFVDRFHSAASTIERVEHVTGADLQLVRSEVADKLIQTMPETREALPWPARIRCRGDTVITSEGSETILDGAFDDCLRRSPLPARLQGYFSQAYLSNEDPWVLRFSPMPDEDSGAWPTSQELGEMTQNPADYRLIRHKLVLLATQQHVPADEMMIAARVQVFTWSEDMILRLWFAEADESNQRVRSHRCPSTMSGRTFAFTFSDWWEPTIRRGFRPLAFAVGGQQRLTLSFPEFFPTGIWKNEFGWSPSPDNPLVWLADGQPVARYERFHGTPRSTQSGHPRQPLVCRWIVKKAVWQKLEADFGPFRLHDDFERFQNNIEQ